MRPTAVHRNRIPRTKLFQRAQREYFFLLIKLAYWIWIERNHGNINPFSFHSISTRPGWQDDRHHRQCSNIGKQKLKIFLLLLLQFRIKLFWVVGSSHGKTKKKLNMKGQPKTPRTVCCGYKYVHVRLPPITANIMCRSTICAILHMNPRAPPLARFIAPECFAHHGWCVGDQSMRNICIKLKLTRKWNDEKSQKKNQRSARTT